MVSATPENLVARAVVRTGLSDFGLDGWQEGLEQLTKAMAVDIVRDSQANARIESMLEERLIKRLRIENWCASNPSSIDTPVEGPIVVFGMPRTATTALHHLLSLDPRFRYLRKWELDNPVPPPDRRTESNDPRRASQIDTSDSQHLRRIDGPVEDSAIYELCFRHSELVLPLPTFTRWWRSADHTIALPYHERMLRLLHSSRPPSRWLLKFPNYLFLLQEMASQYPEARFVMTHRDPVEVIPSACSVVFASRKRRLPDASLDPVRLGREILEHLLAGVQRTTAARVVIGEDRFIDVGKRELELKPTGTVERIYDAIHMEIDDDVRHTIKSWALQNDPGSRGQHHYSAQEFGLTPGAIRQAFATYLEQFGEFIPSNE